MIKLFLKTIDLRKRNLIIYCVLSFLLLWIYIALYPVIEENFYFLKEIIQNFPKGFLGALGIDVETFFTIEGYLASEVFTFIIPLMIILISISFVTWAFAKEIDTGTIEFLLSMPLSLEQIFWAKYLAGVVYVLTFIVLNILSIFPLTNFYNITINKENFLKLIFLEGFFGLSVFSLSIFFSVLFRSRKKASFITGGILLLMFIFKIFAGIKNEFDFLKYFSFFYYLDPTQLLVYNNIHDYTFWFFGLVILIFTFLAFLIFKKRDMVF